MQLIKNAQAGSFESSDILIMVQAAPENSGRKIEIQSNVMLQYGDSIKKEIIKILDSLEVNDIHLIANDKGALSQTIAARVETAIKRAAGIQKGTL